MLLIDKVLTQRVYLWKPVQKSNTTDIEFSQEEIIASDMLGYPLYVSIATISTRIGDVAETVKSILNGEVVPNHIYIMISKEAYMKDKGIPKSNIPDSLIDIMNTKPVTIVYTGNIGPHRKLLPILANKWKEKCAIVTFDDDVKYRKKTLSELIKYYILSGRNSVVALRSHQIGLCNANNKLAVSDYKNWPLMSFGVKEMLQLPTGTGGVLYRPDYFHPVVFQSRFLKLTSTGDDIAFRLACMLKDVQVRRNVHCFVKIDDRGRREIDREVDTLIDR